MRLQEAVEHAKVTMDHGANGVSTPTKMKMRSIPLHACKTLTSASVVPDIAPVQTFDRLLSLLYTLTRVVLGFQATALQAAKTDAGDFRAR